MAQIPLHLEQINLCLQSIDSLSFSGNKSFTNALLANHDITSLIRDTEAHERALFHLAPPPVPTDIARSNLGVAPISSAALKARRSTIQPARQSRNKAVAAVLGGDLYAKIQDPNGRQAGEVNVELLLQGAEKLATVYPIAGALEKIGQLKRRHQQLQANISHYEERISDQTIALQQLQSSNPVEQDLEMTDELADIQGTTNKAVDDVDWTRMHDEIQELEVKKKNLELRVTGMEKDLGGLLR